MLFAVDRIGVERCRVGFIENVRNKVGRQVQVQFGFHGRCAFLSFYSKKALGHHIYYVHTAYYRYTSHKHFSFINTIYIT